MLGPLMSDLLILFLLPPLCTVLLLGVVLILGLGFGIIRKGEECGGVGFVVLGKGGAR